MNNSTQLMAEHIRAAQSHARPNDDWLAQQQHAALADFERLGFPTQKLEQWKYTDIKRVAAAYPEWLGNQRSELASAVVPDLDIAEAAHLVFVDGVYAPDLSAPGELGDNVFFGSIAELEQQDPSCLQALFGHLAEPGDSGFVALNAALSGHGGALVVPAGIELQRPCVLTYLATTDHTSAQPRLLVSLGRGSRATVIEHYCSTAPVIVNAVAELHCAAGARLDYYKLQVEHLQTWHTATQYVRIDRDAHFEATHVDVGGDLARNELIVRLSEPGAHAETKGLFMADGKRHAESRVTVDHLAPNTTSRERYRAILGDNARGVFNGRIYVHQDAQKTSAELSNKNLLLNKGAEINTKPELEIYADDVKCAHGSTTGQLDEASMFYLRTRGISIEDARTMLITAFAAELLTDIAVPAIAAAAQAALESIRQHSTPAVPAEANDI